MPTFYGNQVETYYVNDRGGIYCIQSPDMGQEYFQVKELPDGMRKLPPRLTGDIEIDKEIA